MEIEQIIHLIDERDSVAAIEELARGSDSIESAKSFLDAMTELYWKRKNLPASIAIGRAGVAFATTQAVNADRANDKELSHKLRSTAKALCYNLASFTWDGWDEPGFAITPSDLAVGLDAAKANLRLAEELNKGDLPLSRAYWILAGHELSAGDRSSAAKHYQLGERHAFAAGSKQDARLNQAFAHMVDLLNDPNDAQTQRGLDTIKSDLKQEKDGQEFVRQVETACAVFSSGR
jgi:hypothetical protein